MFANTILSRIVGSTIQTTSQFKDFDGHVITPTSVKLKYKKPNSPVSEIVVTSATTSFATTVMLDVEGEWYFRWECTGDYASAEEFKINVEKSSVL